MPLRLKVTYQYGSERIKLKGAIQRWFNRRFTSLKTVSVKYTFAAYTGKIVR